MGLYQDGAPKEQNSTVPEIYSDGVFPTTVKESNTSNIYSADENKGERENQGLSTVLFCDVLQNGRRNVREEQLPNGYQEFDESRFTSSQDNAIDRGEVVQDRHTEIPSIDENLTRTPGRKCVPKSSGGDDRENTTRKQDHQAQFTERRCFLPSQCFGNTNTENTDFHSAYDTRSCFALCGRNEVSTTVQCPKEIDVQIWPKLSQVLSSDSSYDECNFLVKWVTRMNTSTTKKV